MTDMMMGQRKCVLHPRALRWTYGAARRRRRLLRWLITFPSMTAKRTPMEGYCSRMQRFIPMCLI